MQIPNAKLHDKNPWFVEVIDEQKINSTIHQATNALDDQDHHSDLIKSKEDPLADGLDSDLHKNEINTNTGFDFNK